MKFVSKFSNYRITLEPGLPGNKFTGQAAKPGLYVKFEDGMADVSDEDTIKKIRNHPAFGSDFIEANAGEDKFKETRNPNEPEHNVVELKYGHVEGNRNPRSAIQNKEMKKKAEKMIIEMLKDPKKMAELAKKAGLAENDKTEDKVEVENKRGAVEPALGLTQEEIKELKEKQQPEVEKELVDDNTPEQTDEPGELEPPQKKSGMESIASILKGKK